MTARDEALAALAELSPERIHELRLERITAALNAGATWNQVGAALGQAGSNAHKKYARYLEVTVKRKYRVKPDIGS